MDEQMILSLFISMVVPMFFMLMLFDRKTRQNFIFIIIGTYLCVICGSINGYIRLKTGADTFYLTTTITPVVEEIIKALPILFYALFITDGKKRVLAASSAIGLGFSLLENIFIMTSTGGGPTVPWALARSFGAGLMHCGCSVIVGYGMIYIRTAKKFFATNIFAMLSVAIIYHGMFNVLSDTGIFWIAPMLAFAVFLSLLLIHLKEKNKEDAKKKNSEGKKEDAEKQEFSAKKHEKDL